MSALPVFHSLRVKDVRRETGGCVSVAFDVPDSLASRFRYTQGQFVTLRARIAGAEVRRSYSICSAVQENEVRVAIKRVAGGLFSGWASESLQPGDSIDVMPPEGRFHTPLHPRQARHYVAFAAGSGITPVLSLIKTTLAVEPRSRFTLVYGNRSVGSILFCDALQDVKDRYLERFALYHVLSREHHEVDLFNGRVDRPKCKALLETLIPAARIDEAFLCGPAGMMEDVRAALEGAGLAPEHIHVERFLAPGEPEVRHAEPAPTAATACPSTASVTVVADGKSRTLALPDQGVTILEAALRAGLDLPYACKAGVCCTCRARVLEGQVRMERNYTLEEDEMAQGFVLSCQAHPVTPRVVLSYDER